MELSSSQSATESKSLNTIEEIGIIIAAQDLTPTMMSQDFLKFSGIVPKDWELSQQPVLNPNAAQLNYSNGVSISAQPRTITLSEALSNKTLEEVMISQIAIRYIDKLPHAEYLGMSFSPKILVPFPENPELVRKFITERLLASGSWKDIGQAPVQAGINLMYLLDRCQLSISIAEARLQKPQQEPMAAILFSGSFNYNLERERDSQSKIAQLKQAINFWQSDLQKFRNIVTNKFLSIPDPKQSSLGESVFPIL